MKKNLLVVAAGLRAAMLGRRLAAELEIIEALSRPALSPSPNKYKPHQGKREMERRAARIEKEKGK